MTEHDEGDQNTRNQDWVRYYCHDVVPPLLTRCHLLPTRQKRSSMIIATEQVPHEKGTPPDHSAAHEIHADFHLLPTRQKRNAVPVTRFKLRRVRVRVSLPASFQANCSPRSETDRGSGGNNSHRRILSKILSMHIPYRSSEYTRLHAFLHCIHEIDPE